MLKRLIDRYQQFFERLLLHHPRLAFIWDVIQVFLNRRGTRSAAELAYYLVLTIFPLLIIITAIVGLLPIDSATVSTLLPDILPASSLVLVQNYLIYVQSRQSMTLITGGLITAITAASAAFRSLMAISSDIYGHRVFRGVWSMVFSVVFAVFLLVFIYVSFVVLLTGGWFVRLLKHIFYMVTLPDYLPSLRLLVMFSVAMLSLSLLYWATSPHGEEHPPILFGSGVTALLLTVASSLFSSFISFSTRYSLVYGSLASIIILMVWLYLCGNIVVLGHVVNYVLRQYMRGDTVHLLSENLL